MNAFIHHFSFELRSGIRHKTLLLIKIQGTVLCIRMNAHVEDKGGTAVECVADIAYDPKTVVSFKGNIDLNKLESVINKKGRGRIPFIMITITNNTGGGQPVSRANLKAVKELANKNNIPVFIDAARCAENSYFIQQREEGYEDKNIAEIVKKQFTYADGCTMSAKKDPLVNMGGFIGLNDEELYRKILPHIVLNEGFVTYGGLSGRDLEALGVAIYLEAGVRGVGLGTLAFAKAGKKPGEIIYPKMELFRLAVPRRVYTDRHMDVIAEGFRQLIKKRSKIKGLKITYEPPVLRHFTSRFKLI